MQNLGRFYTTSNFDHEYLRKETWYPKLESQPIETDSSRVQPNKSGELWSTIQKVWREFRPTEIDFFGRLYFGP